MNKLLKIFTRLLGFRKKQEPEKQEPEDECIASLEFKVAKDLNVYISCNFGEEVIDIQLFAELLEKVNSGSLEEDILKIIFETSRDQDNLVLYFYLVSALEKIKSEDTGDDSDFIKPTEFMLNNPNNSMQE